MSDLDLVEMLIEDGPPPWADAVLVLAMWACGCVMLYLGAFRINQAQGFFLALLRVLSAAWMAYAARLSWLLLTLGDLPLSWWAVFPLLVIALCSVGLGAERVLMGRVSYGRRANDIRAAR